MAQAFPGRQDCGWPCAGLMQGRGGGCGRCRAVRLHLLAPGRQLRPGAWRRLQPSAPRCCGWVS